jgi:hypothetical protein
VTKSVVPSGIAASLLVLSVRGTIISANAQSTFGSIVGVVHDSTQAVVPDASVKIRSLEDNSTRSTTSDQNGSFEFVNLKPGDYTLSAEAPGFAEFQVPSAELTARQTLPQSDSRQHHSLSDDGCKPIRRSACPLSQLVHALQHLQRWRSQLQRA